MDLIRKDAKKKLSKRQIDILNIFFTTNKPLMASEIAILCTEIPLITINQTLKKMLENGLVEVESFAKSGKVYSRKYIPTMSKEEFESFERPKKKNPLLNFSASKLIATYVEHKKGDDVLADLDELEKAINECRRKYINSNLDGIQK